MGKSVGGEPPLANKNINGKFINYIFLTSIEGESVALTKFCQAFSKAESVATTKFLPSFFSKSGELCVFKRRISRVGGYYL